MSEVVICLFAAPGYDKAAQGLAGAGRRLADELGARLRAVVLGAGGEALAAELARAADAVTLADQAELAGYQPEDYLAALTQLCGGPETRAVLLANDTYSQELAPRLAHRLEGSAVGDGVELRVEGGALRVVRQVYGGKAQAVIEPKRLPAVAWLRARSFAPARQREESCEVARASLDITPDARARVVERRSEAGGESRLEEARVIVSGGRGIGGPEGFETELKPLAELLGAQLAASRAACDAGWVPPTWQVGQTGKKVTPELYLAVAITGASQHMAGISEAKTIAAINTDPDAPIFKNSRFGIVEDYRKVVPVLREKLAALLRES
ncbi:MAG TPA: electron transfer flavoprotein subunit alpha/FixB family protein [Pyrinomonadaceae bacterium]|nr:electron transfer flavoprotein subunit alpha/FixB family protein [Pyrinomonadaceae bacterium]